MLQCRLSLLFGVEEMYSQCTLSSLYSALALLWYKLYKVCAVDNHASFQTVIISILWEPRTVSFPLTEMDDAKNKNKNSMLMETTQ